MPTDRSTRVNVSAEHRLARLHVCACACLPHDPLSNMCAIKARVAAAAS